MDRLAKLALITLVSGCGGDGGASADPLAMDVGGGEPPTNTLAGGGTSMTSGGASNVSMGGEVASAGSSAGTGGVAATAGAGGAESNPLSCPDAPALPERDPNATPSPIGANAGAVTALNAGNFDQASTDVTEASGGAGMSRGSNKGFDLWQWQEQGAYIEYTVNAETAGTYGIVPMFYAAEAGGLANVYVDDAPIATLHFGAKDELGEYGGVPNCCARGQAATGQFSSGHHTIRLEFLGAIPVDIYGLQVNFTGQSLTEFGSAHVVNAGVPTTISADQVSDFYRMNYESAKDSWPCQKSFCLVEYLLEAEAGSYEVQFNYVTGDGCMAAHFLVNDVSQDMVRLDPGSNTATVSVDLPCGKSRLSIRNPNYFEGEFCSSGADYGQIVVTKTSN